MMRPSLVCAAVTTTIAALVAPAVSAPGEAPGRARLDVRPLDLDRPVAAPVVVDRGAHTHREASPDAIGRSGHVPVDVVERAESDDSWWTSGDVPAGAGVLVGADWGGTATAVAVRARADGGWTEWVPLEVSVDQPDGPEARTANPNTSAPVWFGDVEAFQVRASDPVDLDLHVVEELAGTPVPTSTAEAATTIRPRSAWGADESFRTGSPRVASSLAFGAIHHEGATPRWTRAEVDAGCPEAAAAIRAIYTYHTQSHGWSDIGYNFVVDPCGTAWEGRAGGIDRNVIGAHAAGFNTGSFGVLALGTFHGSSSDEITGDMAAGIRDVFAYKFSLAGIDARGTVLHTGGCSGCTSRYPSGTTVRVPRVSAHQVTSWTACPGEHLVDRLFVGTGPDARPRNWFKQAIHDRTTAPPPDDPDDGGDADDPPDSSGDAVQVSRWAGSTRVGTAVRVSERAFGRADVAVVATTVSASDGLVAGPLAASRGGPVLLTRPEGLPDEVAIELRRLGVSRVDVVGGTDVVRDAVVDDLARLGITRVRRLAGSNRFVTARRVADDVRARTGGRAALVATGAHPDPITAFADAVTAGTYGALTLAPVVLTRPEGLPGASRAALRGSGTVPPTNRVVVVGGRYALSSDIEAHVRDAVPVAVNLTRFAGTNRYRTSALVMDSLVDRGLVAGTRVLMASGGNWPDALAGGAAAAAVRRPLVLVPPRHGWEGSAMDVTTASWGMAGARVVGGPEAVGAGVVRDVRDG